MFRTPLITRILLLALGALAIPACSSVQYPRGAPEISAPSVEVLEAACAIAQIMGGLDPEEEVYFELRTEKVIHFLALQLLTATRDLGPKDFEFEQEWAQRYLAEDPDSRLIDLSRVDICNLQRLSSAERLEPTETIILASRVVKNPYSEDQRFQFGHFIQIRSAGGGSSTYWIPLVRKGTVLVPAATLRLDVSD